MKRSFITWLLVGSLACGALSSCVTTVHRYVWNRAQIVDEVFWVDDPQNVQLYRVDNAYYAKGYIGPARGAQTTHDVPGFVIGLHGGSGLCFYPIKEQGRPVYFRVSEFGNKPGEMHIAEAREKGKKLHLCAYTPAPHNYIAELPSHAVAVTEPGCIMAEDIYRGDASAPARIDAHAWYAYPVGALLAVAVDAPLTAIGNAALAAVASVTVPLSAAVYTCQNAGQQQAAPVPEQNSVPPKPAPRQKP